MLLFASHIQGAWSIFVALLEKRCHICFLAERNKERLKWKWEKRKWKFSLTDFELREILHIQNYPEQSAKPCLSRPQATQKKSC